jgi:hypothetical protein
LRIALVLSVDQKLFDAQLLLYPYEEQLDLPAAFVQSGNGQRRQARVVGQEGQSLLGLGIFDPDTKQVSGVT